MVSFKFTNPTPKSGESLCTTCAHAQVTKGENLERLVTCGRYPLKPRLMEFNVVECTGYYLRGLPSLDSLEKIAWTIKLAPNVAGFVGGAADSEPQIIVSKPGERK